MQFMLIHTHTPENCFSGRPDDRRKCFVDLNASFAKADVKVKGFYTAGYAHTFYFLLEAEDQAALQTALAPLYKVGTGQLIPVMTGDLATMASR
jgi:hypothetical protein